MIGTAGTVVVFRRLERPARSSSETIACCLLAIVFCPLKGARATMSKSHSSNCARPAGAFLRTIGLAAGLAILGTGAIEKAQGQTDANPMKPIPIPAQVPAKDGVAQIPETRLWYWDTGGPGVPIVLLHPATGSALIWGYQQPVFALAGYRVIAYSRRGHHNSEPVPHENPGTASQDLHNLVEFLGLRKFHAVASAAGCAVTVDYAHSHPERLSSMVLACGLSGVTDASYVTASERLRPKG